MEACSFCPWVCNSIVTYVELWLCEIYSLGKKWKACYFLILCHQCILVFGKCTLKCVFSHTLNTIVTLRRLIVRGIMFLGKLFGSEDDIHIVISHKFVLITCTRLTTHYHLNLIRIRRRAFSTIPPKCIYMYKSIVLVRVSDDQFVLCVFITWFITC